MRIGFLGTGAITEAVVTGLATAPEPPDIVVSPRTIARSRALAQCFGNVAVAADNQAVLDRADIVVLARLGTVVSPLTEGLLEMLWSTTALMAPFYEQLNQVSGWLVANGVPAALAGEYTTRLFAAWGEVAVEHTDDLAALRDASQTRGGLNEQALRLLGYEIISGQQSGSSPWPDLGCGCCFTASLWLTAAAPPFSAPVRLDALVRTQRRAVAEGCFRLCQPCAAASPCCFMELQSNCSCRARRVTRDNLRLSLRLTRIGRAAGYHTL